MTDRYERVRELGRGAAGEVWLVRDLLLEGREVALKRIGTAVDEALRHAFEREFATMASLSVDGVAQVFDFGLEQGQPFYTRAYIAGRPLDQLAKLLSPLERVRMLCQVAQVIAPLHRVGVVHGDIKPGNAIIDAQGGAHVIDFGLARVLGRDRSEGAVGGTLPFMAPELLRGDAPSVQSDVFALGATLWVLLTDEFPFGRRGLLDAGATEPPQPPAECDDVTRAALTIARRALAPDPLDRLPTAPELVVALGQALPELASAPAKRVFVPPRPRGHGELVAQLQAAVAGTERAVLLSGPIGSGKSLLLRELKWRLQIRGTQVIELSAAAGDATSMLSSFARQLEIALGADMRAGAARRALSALAAGKAEGSETSDALAEALFGLASHGPVAVIVDDLDAAESACGAVLRSVLFAGDSNRTVSVVATARDAAAASVKRLEPEVRLEVPRLGTDDARALAVDALGPLDASTLDALIEHSQGLPAALIDALAALFQLTAPTVADVRRLPPAGAGLALAHERLAHVSTAGRKLLEPCALIGRPLPRALLIQLGTELGLEAAEVESALAGAERAGLLARRVDGVALVDTGLEKALRRDLGVDGTRELASRVLGSRAGQGLPIEQRAWLAVHASDATRVRALIPTACERLTARGAHAAAAELYEALLACCAEGDRVSVTLSLARCKHACGDLPRAVELGQSLIERDDLSAAQRVDATLLIAQSQVALGRFDDAVAMLSTVSRGDASAWARAQRELARVHLRRGDYDALLVAAEAGLSCAEDDVLRSELLCARGMAASYRADHETARQYLEEAVALARRAGSPREEANALGTLALARFRTGDPITARDSFSQCLEIARRTGDIGSMANFALNLGAVLFCLGEPTQAAEHYESAVRLASRAGRSSTHMFARSNLALVHIYFGLYERAKAELGDVVQRALAAGQKYNQAQATALLGDVAARTGDVERALIHYDDAIARYGELGQTREIAEHNLDAAEALLDRGGPADPSAAAARLSAARERVAHEGLSDLELRLDLLLARARLASGDADGALASLQSVIDRARKTRNRDLEWSALSAAAQAQETLGAEFAARRFHRLSVEVLEEIALRIPREHREAFWHDPRRRRARDLAQAADDSQHRVQSAPGIGDLATLMGDVRAERLLEIIKRLASEHDIDRLLQRITESAVDMSGAERGYVILVEDGKLERRTMEVAKSQQPDPHAAFSRSIAEAVLIDGEAIVTVDATRDGRLSEYVSVHKLMLRSVACLPIRGHTGTVGVLYLEHRHSRGRFSESSVQLLQTFADQAAIAVENARLMAKDKKRQAELEELNAALARAKSDVEELLEARTEELLAAQRELSRTRRSARVKATRHGMVGQSACMVRVFDAIDRVQGARVPVIIQGESGTGKELVAHAIHDAGARARGPFIALNCGSVPESLLESELFGHVEGAFSGADKQRRGLIARASGGTLFLDEVGDMPPRMQVDLLRVLQEGTVCKIGSDEEEKVDVRFIAASNRRLQDLVREGRFREDLYYRLNVVEISLPPLRERRDDIGLLSQHFLATFAEREGRPEKRLSRAALERLCEHPLPGNVRQLEHLLLQACVLVEGTTIEASDLALEAAPLSSTVPPLQPVAPTEPPQSLGDFRTKERRDILAALEAHGWNRARAAKALGMPRRTFYRRLQEHSIL
jgi:serine/threonine-protein kinase PknK